MLYRAPTPRFATVPSWLPPLLAALLLASPLAAAAPQDPNPDTDPYLARALDSYRRLQVRIQGSSNYWRIGNVVDTMFDFLAMPEWSDAQASHYQVMPTARRNLLPQCPRTLASYAACSYAARQPGSLWWYDDWSWWGIASSKAFLEDPLYRRIFGEQDAAAFQAIARSTWDIARHGFGDGVHQGAPNVWENRENQTGYLDFQPPFGCQADNRLLPPRFPGGVWQFELYTNGRTAADGWSGPVERSAVASGNPNEMSLGPFQNTVTNGLYFTFAQRLLAHDPLNREEYGQAAAAEYGFLRQWFAYDQDYQLPTAAGDGCPGTAGCGNLTSLLQILPAQGSSDPAALVGERVSSYAAPGLGAGFPPVRGWYPDVFWTGDQGLLLGGLIDYLRAHPDDPMSREVAPMILKGVMRKLVQDGDLQPYSPLAVDPRRDPQPGTLADPGDYASGSGIFMRYLLYAATAKFPAGQSHPLAEVLAGKEFQTFLAAAAQAAYCDYSPDADLFPQFNVLATLVTARQLLLPAYLPTRPPSCG